MAAIVTGLVFNDLNKSGTHDALEPGIPNAYVVLRDPNTGICTSTITDANGVYTFANITTIARYEIYETVADPGTTCPPTNFAQPAGFLLQTTTRFSDDVNVTNGNIVFDQTVIGPNFGHTTDDSNFGCPGIGWQSAGGTDLYEVNMVSGISVLKETYTIDFNGIGFNPKDGFLYGIQNIEHLIRINPDYTYTDIGKINNLPGGGFLTGTIDSNGYYYIGVPGSTRYYTIDLSDQNSATYGQLVEPQNGYVFDTSPYGSTMSGAVTFVPVYDWSYLTTSNKLWGANGNDVYSLDPVTGIIQRFLNITILPGGIKGASYSFNNGELYVIDNNDGKLYKINFAAGVPTDAIIYSQAESRGFMDGASCPVASILIDYGDAPDTSASNGPDNYSTLFANDGPRHQLLNELTLGTKITSEADAYQNPTATGDDILQGIQDDGTTFPLPPLATNAVNYSLNVDVVNNTGVPANVYGWVDFNKNGVFDGNEASLIQVVPSAVGTQQVTLKFTVPGTVTLTKDHTFVRVRITTDDMKNTNTNLTIEDTRSIGGASDGEVEDYYLAILDVADISVDKSGTPNPVIAGDILVYTMTIANLGPAPAENVVITDTLPTCLLNSSYTVNGGSSNPWSAGGVNLGTIPVGGTPVVVKITSNVDPGCTEVTLPNTASVNSSTFDNNTNNNNSAIVTNVNTEADISVVKSGSPNPVIAGNSIVYTVTVANAGPSNAQSVTLTDSTSACILNPVYSINGGVVSSLPVGGISLGTIVAGSTPIKVEISGDVDPSCINNIDNIANVESSTSDPNTSNNTATITTTLNTLADISIIKDGSPNPVIAGNNLVYTMTITNAGPSDAQNVTLQDSISSCILSPVYSINGGTSNPWPAGGVNIGTVTVASAPIIVEISGLVDSTCSTTIVNTATISSTTQDPNLSDNSSSINTAVNTSADISAVKVASPSPVVAGNTLTYTVTVANAGPSVAQNVLLTDTTPACLINPVYSINGGTSNPWPASGVNLGTVPVGGTPISVVITGTVDKGCLGTLNNTASVSSTTPDPNTANNNSSINTPINTSADLSVVKNGNPNPVIAGNALTYDITVSNAGPSDALNTVLTDTISSCLVSPVYSINGGSQSPLPLGGISLGTVPAGAAPIAVQISGNISPSCLESTIPNIVSVNSSTTDPNTNNNNSLINTTVNTSADLSVVKSGNPNPVVAGELLTYTVTIANAGPSDALNVVLTDTTPACILNPVYSINGGAQSPWPAGGLNLGTVPAGSAQISVVISGIVDSSCSGTLNNTAIVNSSTSDPNSNNNTSSVDNRVDTLADIKVIKGSTPNPVIAGNNLVYTMTITNAGPSDAQNVTLQDSISSCILSPVYSINGGTSNPWPAGGVNIGTVTVASAPIIVEISGLVDSTCSTTIVNTATISSTTQDPNLSDNSSSINTAVNTSADISAVKVASPSPVVAGNTLTYTVTVANAGPSVAQNVLLTDTTPACLINPVYSINGGISNPWPASGVSLGTVPVGGTPISVVITGTVDKACLGTLNNTASVSSTTPDANTANNNSSINTPINTSADLSVVKNGNPNPVIAGNALTYDITVSNAGPSDALNTVLTDTVASCLVSPVYSINGGSQSPLPLGGISLGTVPAGGTPIAVQISGNISPSCLESTIPNIVSVNSSTTDPNTNNNNSLINTTVNTSADLSVVKSGNPNPVVAGELLTYTVTIANAGPSDALNVVLTDTTPACILNPVYSINGGAQSPWPVGGLNLGTVPVGAAQISVVISGIVDSACSGTLNNTAIVNSSTSDPNNNNNTSSVDNRVDTLADIKVIKSSTPNPVIAGNNLVYTMTITNDGPSDAQNVTLTENLSNCLLNPIYSLNGGLSNPWPVGGIYLGTIKANAPAQSLQISGTIDTSCSGTIPNTAVVSSTTKDPNENDNTATIITNIDTLADLSIVKTSSPEYLDRGDVVTYTIVVKNDGPSDAINVTLTDIVPAEITNAEFSINGGGTWSVWSSPYNIGILQAKSSKTILIRGKISDNAKGIVNNTAKITSTTPDSNPNNNTSNSGINVNYADLTAPGNFTKSVDKAYADIGDELTYTLTIKNTGNSVANNVVITDPIPSGTSYVQGSLQGTAQITGTPETVINVTNGIAAGDILIINYKVKVIEVPIQNPIPNTATVSYKYTVNPSNPNGSSGSGNTNTVTTKVNHGEILPENITKSSNNNTTTPGDIITYTVTGKNTGNVPINVVVKDVVPTGTSFELGSVVINNIPKPNENPGTGINVGVVNPNENFIVTFKVKVLDSANNKLSNTATINYTYTVDPNNPPVSKDLTSNVVDVAVLRPGLTISKNPSRVGAVVGDIIRYSIIVTNTGELPLSNVIIKDALAPELQYENNLTINGVLQNQSIITGVNVGSLAIGEGKTIAFDTKVISNPGDKIINNTSTGTFDYSLNGQTFKGSSISNEDKVRVYSPKLDITKTSNKQSVKVGDIFNYTIIAKNSGDIVLNNVIVKDTLPIEFKVLGITIDGIANNGDIGAGINIGSLNIGQSKLIVLTVQAIGNLDLPYKNIAKATGEAKTDPNSPPTIVVGEGTDNKGVAVFNPELTLNKSVDMQYAIVGEELTYTITATNTGDIALGTVNLDPVFISDILSSSLEFIPGTVTIDGVQAPNENIINGVDVGVLDIGQSTTITFKAKVLSNDINPIENNAKVTFGYQLPGELPETGTSNSNTVKVFVEDPNIDIIKTANKDLVVLGDTITYTVILKNNGTLDAFNVIFKDNIPKEVELVNGTFSVDGRVINSVDIRKGVNIGTIKKGEQAVIKYTVKVIKSNCDLKIINEASAKYNYRLLDGRIGSKETDKTSDSTTTVNLGISNFKQFSIEENLCIPNVKPNMEEISTVTGDIKIIKCHIINTPVSTSNEGQILTGYKLIIHGELSLIIEYTALDEEQTVHSAHFDMPFTTFIVLPEKYSMINLGVEGIIEDIYYKELDCRRLFANTSVLIKAWVCYEK